MKGKIILVVGFLFIGTTVALYSRSAPPEDNHPAKRTTVEVLRFPELACAYSVAADLFPIAEIERTDEGWIRVKYPATSIPGKVTRKDVRIRGPTRS